MSTASTYKSTASFKFLLVGAVTLTFVGLSLFFLTSNLDDIQKLIEREVTHQYLTMTLNYPLERIIFDLEQDIHKIAEDHFHAPQNTDRLSQDILSRIAKLKNTFDRHAQTAQKDTRIELLDSYAAVFKRYINLNTEISDTITELDETQRLFLAQLDAMEQQTGAKMVEYTLTGQDTTVLRQMFAIIPFCREQVLNARYAISFESLAPAISHEIDDIQTLAVGAFQDLGRALDTLTSGYSEISAYANLLLNEIPGYSAKVIALQNALKRHQLVQKELDTARAELVVVLDRSREGMLQDMDLLQSATHKLSQRALLVTCWVSLLVLCALILAWLILKRVGQRVERGMHEAIGLKQELEEKNKALIHEIGAREEEERSRKLLETQLQQAQKMEAIGTLAGGIAHDFNNILAAMIGYAELAAMRTVKGRDVSRELDEIRKAGGRAKNLTLQILAFSRSSEQNFVSIQIALIVEEAIRLLKATLPATISVSLRIHNHPESLLVMADQTQIHQIIMNLCTNAFHAMRSAGGKLEVVLERTEYRRPAALPEGEGLSDGSYVKILVKDNGCGIDPAARERIFEPYFTTKDRSEGTGMGLAVVHGIVRAHLGQISCTSEPGVGTSFEVLLPLAGSEAEPLDLLQEEDIVGGSERILFVDDEAAIAAVHEKMLRALGYQISTVMSSKKALQIFKADPEQFDLVITDMTMPKMTGAVLARKMLEIRPELPILMCTGFSDQIDEKQALELGIRGFLIKPVSLQKLADSIRQLLDQN